MNTPSQIPPFNPNTQNGKVLEHLQSGRSITSLEAIKAWGCTRLSARIGELKEAGYPIQKQFISVETRGGTTSVAEYFMESET